MGSVTGGELLVRTLMKAGVEKLFGLHGAHVDSVFQSCLDHDVPIVDTRHEVAAGHAAEGYARADDRLGVALVTAGPGFTNVVTSIANAYLDRTPVIYISGAAGLTQAETNTLQAGIDQLAIAAPITKWAHRVTVTADIPRLVAQAVRTALAQPRGPVLLDIPSDVLGAGIDEDAIEIPDPVPLDGQPAADPEAIDRALALLREAERPIAMLGAGLRPGSAEAVRRLVEASGIPAYSDFAAHGLLPSDHPLYGGTFHKLADLDQPGGRSDAVLALGVRFGLFTLGKSGLIVPPEARIVHVESDPVEIGRLLPVAEGIVSDPTAAAESLARRAEALDWPDRSSWQETVHAAKAARRERNAADLARGEPPIHPLQAVHTLVDALPPDTIVVGDGAEAYHWLNEAIGQARPASYLTHGFLGAVGFGIGLALGAKAAHPDRPVLCLAGDGAVGFTIAEFDTMVRNDLPVVVMVMNNRSWAASQHFQELAVGPNRVAGTRLGDAHYHDVAAGFGANGAHVRRIEELAPAIRDAFAQRRPACINVEIDLAPIPPEVHLLMKR